MFPQCLLIYVHVHVFSWKKILILRIFYSLFLRTTCIFSLFFCIFFLTCFLANLEGKNFLDHLAATMLGPAGDTKHCEFSHLRFFKT